MTPAALTWVDGRRQAALPRIGVHGRLRSGSGCRIRGRRCSGLGSQAHDTATSAPSRSISTRSSPSTSTRRTWMTSSCEVGTFLPTWSARMGSSRCPRSIEHGQADGARPPEVHQGVHRGPDRPARVEDVVDDDERQAVEVERQVGAFDDRLVGDEREVIAVEGDVERPDGDGDAFVRSDGRGHAVGEGDAAALDADEGQVRRCRRASRRPRG